MVSPFRRSIKSHSSIWVTTLHAQHRALTAPTPGIRQTMWRVVLRALPSVFCYWPVSAQVLCDFFTLKYNKSSYHSNFHITWCLCYLWDSEQLLIEILTNTPCESSDFFFNFFLLLEEKRDFKPPEISETCWEVVPLFQEEHCLLHSRKCISEETEESGSFQKYSSSTKKMEKCLPKRASCSVKDTARLKRSFVSMVTEFGVRTSPASDIAKSKTQLLLFMQRAGFLTLPCPNKQLISVLLSNFAVYSFFL